MSSSTSSSDRDVLRPAWQRFCLAFLIMGPVLFAGITTFLIMIDPYDTGRTIIPHQGVAKQGPRTANASRGRDPAFNAAIIGNSHIQLVEPERLTQASDARFVSLIVPATYPREQFVVLDWFLRSHPEPKAIVIGLDENWCRADFFTEKPFPYWLYDQSFLTYAIGLARYPSLERLPGRFQLLRGRGQRAVPDGYWNYDTDYRAIGYGNQELVDSKLKQHRPVAAGNTGPFVAAIKLANVLQGLPATTRVVLAWPPVHINAIPEPGSAAERSRELCRDAFRRIAERRARTSIVDWAVDRPENRDPTRFFDLTHYQLGLAKALEQDIIAALRS